VQNVTNLEYQKGRFHPAKIREDDQIHSPYPPTVQLRGRRRKKMGSIMLKAGVEHGRLIDDWMTAVQVKVEGGIRL
jgi:hypothetical protein